MPGHGKQPGWDDVFIFFSLALGIIATTLVSYSVTLGLGRHTAAVIAEHGMEGTIMAARWQIIAFPSNIGAFSFPNISIAILVSNLLDPNPPRTYALYAMSIVQVIFAMVSVFVVFLQCSPTEKLWSTSLPGTCWDPSVFNNYSYWVSAYTTLTDIVLAIMPISAFWNLQMRFPKKLSVCIMMGSTLLSAIVTIVKATYLHLFTDRTDPLWNVVPLVSWGLIEQNVVIVAACIPTPSSAKPFNPKTPLLPAPARVLDSVSNSLPTLTPSVASTSPPYRNYRSTSKRPTMRRVTKIAGPFGGPGRSRWRVIRRTVMRGVYLENIGMVRGCRGLYDFIWFSIISLYINIYFPVYQPTSMILFCEISQVPARDVEKQSPEKKKTSIVAKYS